MNLTLSSSLAIVKLSNLLEVFYRLAPRLGLDPVPMYTHIHHSFVEKVDPVGFGLRVLVGDKLGM